MGHDSRLMLDAGGLRGSDSSRAEAATVLDSEAAAAGGRRRSASTDLVRGQRHEALVLLRFVCADQGACTGVRGGPATGPNPLVSPPS